MKFNNKEEKVQKNKHNNEIEIVMGDNSELDISDVGDCMNDLRPKNHNSDKKNVVIPKTKK